MIHERENSTVCDIENFAINESIIIREHVMHDIPVVFSSHFLLLHTIKQPTNMRHYQKYNVPSKLQAWNRVTSSSALITPPPISRMAPRHSSESRYMKSRHLSSIHINK
jgi:hypothetical protein